MTDDQQKTQQQDAPANVTAPEGSREDGVTDGANTNFGPTLDSVPHEGGVTKPDSEDGR